MLNESIKAVIFTIVCVALVFLLAEIISVVQ